MHLIGRSSIVVTVAALVGVVACSQQQGDARSSSANSGVPTSFTDSGTPSFANIASAHPESTPAAQSAQTPQRPRAFDLCRILPTDSVSRLLESTIHKSVSTSQTRPAGMCTYRGGSNVSVTIDIGRDRSAASAGVTFIGLRGSLGRTGIATKDVSGVGDEAFGSTDAPGRYSVMMREDAVTGKVTVSVQGGNAQALRPAAIELAKRTLDVLRQPAH